MKKLEALDASSPGVFWPAFGAEWRRAHQSLSAGLLRDFLVLFSGSATAQVLGLAFAPIITRIYTPAEFGVFGAFSACLGILASAATLEYAQALVLAKRDGEAASLLGASLVATLSLSLLATVAIALFWGQISGALAIGDRPLIMWLLPAGLLFSGVNQAMQAWCVRRKAFKESAVAQIVRAISAGGMQTGLGAGWPTGGALAVSGVAAESATSTFLINRLWKRERRLWPTAWSRSRIVATARKYVDFPVFAAPQNLLNAASQGIPVLLLAHYYGVAAAGAYALSIRVLQAPMNFIVGSVRQVLFQRIAETHHAGQSLFPLFARSSAILLVLGLAPAVILFVFAPQIVAFIFGAEWFTAGQFVRWLVPWQLFGFCNVPSVLVARTCGYQRWLLLYDAVMLLSRVGALVLGGLLLNKIQTVALYSGVGAVFNIALIATVGAVAFAKARSSAK